MPNQSRERLRILFGALLFAVTAMTGILAVVVTGFAPFRETLPAADRLAELVGWLYLAAGLLLGVWRLMDLRGGRILLGLWLVALALMLGAFPPLRSVGGILLGLACAAAVSGLAAAANGPPVATPPN